MNHGLYQPYLSDEEESDIDSDDSYEDSRIWREEDPRYAILRKPTVPLKNRIIYDQNAPGAPWDESTNIKTLKDHTYLEPPKATKTSLVSIKSYDRDRSVYPTSYNFQLKLPRVYKNITKFQLVQLSFPNSSGNAGHLDVFTSTLIDLLLDNGIPAGCTDTCISVLNCVPETNGFGVMELGRMSITTGMSLMTTISVPETSHSKSQLANELSYHANSTPPLNIISYSTFYDIFTNTRDIMPLFNEPGDSYYSRTTQQRFQAHTKENIMNSYYHQVHIDRLGDITDHVAYVAYYFPILKEVFATKRSLPFLKMNEASFEESERRVMGPFEGFDSPFYYDLCSTNQHTLDQYRPHLTFELRPINKYRWIYNDKDHRFTTIHDSLNTSLTRDFATRFQALMTDELSICGLHANSFQTLKGCVVQYSNIYRHLEKNLSTVMANYFLASNLQYSGGSTYSTADSTFHVSDLHNDENFTTMFQYKSTIGRLYGNYSGMPMCFTNFLDYHSTLSNYYTLMTSTTQNISSIHGRVHSQHHEYVSTKYSNVLPIDMISSETYMSNQSVPVSFVTNARVYVPGILPSMMMMDPAYSTCYSTCIISSISEYSTFCNLQYPDDPVAISTCIEQETQYYAEYDDNACSTLCYCAPLCCKVLTRLVNLWYGCLPTNTVIGTLQYKLGLIDILPSTFNILSTISQFASTQNTNFFLQINEEQGFNNLDVVMPEDRRITNEPTGQVKMMAAKILMTNIGGNSASQSLIQNPTLFENTLGKLDRLNFKVYYDDANLTPAWNLLPFFPSIHEWNATFQIDEEVGYINQDVGWSHKPTVPVPNNPDDTPYLFFAHKENPNTL